MMELNNLTDLADLLRGLSNDEPTDGMGFDMCHTLEDSGFTNLTCGSACCIGGWVHYMKPELEYSGLVRAVATLLPEALGIDDPLWDELEKLCFPDGDTKEGAWKATPQQAARAVEILRDTGKCDWDRAMREVTA